MAVAQKSGPGVRGQVITPRSSKRTSKTRSRQSGTVVIGHYLKFALGFAKPAAILAAVVLLIFGYNIVANSSLFELRRVEIEGGDGELRAGIEQLVRRSVGQTKLLDVDITRLREKVESLPRIRHASVARMLPDGIYIRFVEREPVIPVRHESGKIVWLDADAVEIGELSDLKYGAGKKIPPVAVGFSEDTRSRAAADENQERIKLYKQMEQEFSNEPDPVWNLVDEVDLTFIKNVTLRLADPAVTVVVGSKDFRSRFEEALRVLSAVRRRDSEMLSRYRIQDVERLIQNADNISYIDSSRHDRIVLNFSTPGTEKNGRQEKK